MTRADSVDPFDDMSAHATKIHRDMMARNKTIPGLRDSTAVEAANNFQAPHWLLTVTFDRMMVVGTA